MTSSIKVIMAQINPTIGDVGYNADLHMSVLSKHESADLVVFPELSLTGYYPGDLLLGDEIWEKIDAGIKSILSASTLYPNMTIIIGTPFNRKLPSNKSNNTALVIKNGAIIKEYHKQLLPTYNVFDEHRHFFKGDVSQDNVLEVQGVRVGILICEDAWNEDFSEYATDPVAVTLKKGIDILVSLNASPSNLGKTKDRERVYARISATTSCIYVNQIGGHDQLVYDGGSFIAYGKETSYLNFFKEDIAEVIVHKSGKVSLQGRTCQEPPSKYDMYLSQIKLGLVDYMKRCGFSKVVVGSSGGIDSALTLALAVKAIGAENVVAITMPSEYSSEGSISDSQELCNNLGIPLLTYPIKTLVNTFADGFEQNGILELSGLTKENIQARIRGTILMSFSNKHGHLLLTTGNKSEVSVGYATLYGDMAGGLSLIGDMYKTEVFALSKLIPEIPRSIIEKEPSAELAPGQRDIDSLPPYPVLDAILMRELEGDLICEKDRLEIISELSFVPDNELTGLVAKIKGLVSKSEYKRKQAPPILRLRHRAFGTGRQVPIAAKH